MVWIDVSPTIATLINEEHIALEVIKNTRDLCEELKLPPRQPYADGVSLEEDLWIQFNGRWMEITGHLPRLDKEYFRKMVEGMIPKTGQPYHSSFAWKLESATLGWINKRFECGHKPEYEEYFNYFTGKGVWEKSLMDYRSYHRLADMLADAKGI